MKVSINIANCLVIVRLITDCSDGVKSRPFVIKNYQANKTKSMELGHSKSFVRFLVTSFSSLAEK